MASEATTTTRPHVVLTSFPAQGHLKPMLNLAKLLHSHNFHVTFVVTDFTYRRLIRSRGPESVRGLDDFRFRTIPDGLPPSDLDATQDIPALCESARRNFLAPFMELMRELNNETDSPRVTCIVSDGAMSFAAHAGHQSGIPVMLFYTHSGCGLLSYISFSELVKRGYSPLKDESLLTTGYLDTPIDCIPGMSNVRLRDLPSFIRATNPDDVMLNIMIERKRDALQGDGIILNTFEELEPDVLSSIRSHAPNLYTIGPLSPLCRQSLAHSAASAAIGSNLWKEDGHCLNWLDKQGEGAVVYVNFGSITVVTKQELEEFAWGLANSMRAFLWVVRPDLVSGEEAAMLPDEFVREIEGRGILAKWCDQEAVLAHRSVGGFLTHCGWNSTLESIYEGVAMVCWPFFAEQHTNCRYACAEWGIGMEVDNSVRREEVERLIRELMGGEKGREMRRRALGWKEKARQAIGPGGSSYMGLQRLVEDLLQVKRL